MLHICLVTFIWFISYTKVNLIHFVINFQFIHFIEHSPSYPHLPYLFILIRHRISTSLSFSFFKQSRLLKLGVFLDKVLIWNTYCITWSRTPIVLLLLVTLQESQQLLPQNENYFLPRTAISSGSRMLAKSKKKLFVAIAFTESH